MSEQPTRILIVDDHPVFRFGLRALLEAQADMAVVGEAESGETAVTMTQSLQPNVILMDINLPGMSGYDILKALRAEEASADMPVLMLTARGQKRDRELAERYGASRFMTKPFANEDVLGAVRELTNA